MSIKHKLLEWFGLISTLILGVMAFAPKALHIAAAWRPWVFVIFIFWFFAFCAEIFNHW